MKSLTTLTIGALVAVSCFAQAGQADTTQKIKAYYTIYDALLMKKDANGLVKLMNENSTDDFVSIEKPDATGKSAKRNRSQTVEAIKSVLPMVDSFSKVSSHIDHITVGKTSILVALTQIAAMTTKKLPQDGKVHQFTDTEKSEETWVKSGGTWKIKQAKTISDTSMMDGKPMSR